MSGTFHAYREQGDLDLRLPMSLATDFVATYGRRTRIERIATKLAYNMRTRCIGSGIEITITAVDIIEMLREQRMRCALSGIRFDPDAKRDEGVSRNPLGASIDRIDSRRGYVKGNVRLVLTSVNYGLNEWGTDHYKTVCHAVARRDRQTSDEGIMATGNWKYSTRPMLVFQAPDLTDVRDDALLSLDEAVWLPELNGQFEERDLYRSCAKGSLESARPTGKMHYTTRAWVRKWVADSCHANASPPASSSTKGSGASATASGKSALASARQRTRTLRLA